MNSGSEMSSVSQRRNSTSNISDIITSDSFINRILSGRSTNNNQNLVQIEEEIDIDQNLELYKNHQFNILNPKILYQTGMINLNTVLIKSSREESIRVTDNTYTIDLISPETIRKIKQTKKKFMHFGLIVIGLKGLGRKELGTKVLSLLLDKSWKTDVKKAIISGMEQTESDETKSEFSYMNIIEDENIYESEPIYDTETEEYDLIGYCKFDEFEFEEEGEDFNDIITETGFKIEETKNSIEQIINKNINEQNIQEQVDDMLIPTDGAKL